MIALNVLTGAALDAALDDVARLRISVFRAFPYLYDGDLAYERTYLETYRGRERSVLVGAFDGARLVGAATGTPLLDHPDFADAFATTTETLSGIFYCAESVLMPDYRGRGIGHAFFDAREAHARRFGYRKSAFCAVDRAADHLLRPAGYAPLDPFWRKRGYAPLTGIKARFDWKDIDQPMSTEKTLQFWIKTL